MSGPVPSRLSIEEVLAEGGTMLPAKEVLSLLDLNVDLDLALDLAAPIDLAVAANANVAAPITGAVSANVLSLLSTAAAGAEQNVTLDQGITGEAIASAPQTAVIDQTDDIVSDGTGDTAVDVPELPVTDPTDPLAEVGSILEGDLLNVDVIVDLDADLAAPVAGAVALNANVAAPIDASVAANVGSVGSQAVSMATQTASITQSMDGVVADATAAQDATIEQ